MIFENYNFEFIVQVFLLYILFENIFILFSQIFLPLSYPLSCWILESRYTSSILITFPVVEKLPTSLCFTDYRNQGILKQNRAVHVRNWFNYFFQSLCWFQNLFKVLNHPFNDINIILIRPLRLLVLFKEVELLHTLEPDIISCDFSDESALFFKSLASSFIKNLIWDYDMMLFVQSICALLTTGKWVELSSPGFFEVLYFISFFSNFNLSASSKVLTLSLTG